MVPRRYLDQRLKLHLLRAVDAINTHRSLLKAAAALGLSQPDLTKSLAELEETLQLRLFDRHPRGVRPTDAGTAVVASSKRSLAELRRLDEGLDLLSVPGGGAVTLGALPGVLTRLKSSHPEMGRSTRHPVWEILARAHLRQTLSAVIMATGIFGGAYVMITWLPTCLRTVFNLSVTTSAGYLALNIVGSLVGPFCYGWLSDRVGRRPAFMTFLILQAGNVAIYLRAPVVIALSFFLGAFQGGLAAGMLPTFSDRHPGQRARPLPRRWPRVWFGGASQGRLAGGEYPPGHGHGRLCRRVLRRHRPPRNQRCRPFVSGADRR